MKVNLFLTEDEKGFQAAVENGPNFEAKKNEKLDKFKARVEKWVQDNHLEEAEFVELTSKALKRMGTPQLETLVLGLDGLGETMVREILDLRQSAKSAAGTSAKVPSDEVAAQKKAEKEAAKKAKEEAAAQKKAEKEAAAAKKKEEKAAKEATKKEKPTLAQVQEIANENRKNINNVFDFTSFDGTEDTGVLVNVIIDKRVPVALLRFKTTDGKIKHKTAGSEDVKLNEEATKTHLEEVARLAAEKEANKKSKGSRGKSPAAVAEREAIKAEKKATAAEEKAAELRAKADELRAKAQELAAVQTAEGELAEELA